MTRLEDMNCMHPRMDTERKGDSVSSFGNTSNNYRGSTTYRECSTQRRTVTDAEFGGRPHHGRLVSVRGCPKQCVS